MRRGEIVTKAGWFCLCALVVASVRADITIEPIGRFATGIFDGSAAEIGAYDPVNQRVFVTNSASRGLDAIDISDPTLPALLFAIDLTPFGDEPTSVAFRGRMGVVAVKADPVTDPGTVVFFNSDGDILGMVEVGSLPDSVHFTPDGRYVLVANEGEPNDEYTVDPEGSVSVIDVSAGGPDIVQSDVRTADFSAFNRLKHRLRRQGVRIYGPTVIPPAEGDEDPTVIEGGASVAQDLEPEYIAISDDSRAAWVALQENNALALLDIGRARIRSIIPLGFKNHLRRGNGFDASNRDDAINIRRWPTLGMYQPDWVTAFTVDGRTYLATANEGDARDYDGFSEEERVGDLALAGILARIPGLQEDENLGRLKTTNSPPDGKVPGGGPEGEDAFRRIYSYGARSFTIWTANGRRVFDSGDALERITAVLLRDDFNSTDDASPSGDSRSDDKGPEPEAITVAGIGGCTYVFIGLERPGGIVIYNVSDPEHPLFVDYINFRDFSVRFDIGDCEDCEEDCEEDVVEDCQACKDACARCADCPEGEDCTEDCTDCEDCGGVFDECEECNLDCPVVAELVDACIEECVAENCPVAGVEGRDPLDLAPEGILFIPEDQSPAGFGPLLVVTNEVSGSTTIYSIVGEPSCDDDNDGAENGNDEEDD